MRYPNRYFYVLSHIVVIPTLLGWLAYSVQYSKLDMALASYFFDASSRTFPLRHQALAVAAADLVNWLVLPALILAGGYLVLRSYRNREPQQARSAFRALFAVFVLAPLLVWMLKHDTALPRPYTLSIFGGTHSMPSTFWAFGKTAAGGALPSNHAAVGYSLFGLYFAGWALGRKRLRWVGLILAIATGVAFSFLRISQGAHFPSETLWSAAMVWLLCSMLFYRPINMLNGTRRPEARHRQHPPHD